MSAITATNPMVRGLTREIMSVLGITDENLAVRVETEMHQHIRFSECTKREFNREARTALQVIREIDKRGAENILAELNA